MISFILKCIRTFHKANLLETLINMTASNNHVKYAINLVEIITLTLREQVNHFIVIFY
jgi:hypothetical protein